MPNAIPLPARLHVDAACDLWARITAAEAALPLDARNLRHIGAAGLQVLLMADRLARARGSQLRLLDLPEEARAQLRRLGAADHFADATGAVA